MSQLFVDHANAQASNVCLFLGPDAHGTAHMPCDHHRYRMGFEEWNNSYPGCHARLQSDPISWLRTAPQTQDKPRPSPKCFRIYPHLRRSYVTEPMAAHFALQNLMPINNIEPDPIPLPPATHAIQSLGFYEAYIAIECSQAIQEPVPIHRLRFHVLFGVPGEIGIIGRNVLEHMLLLYRARSNHCALRGSRHRGRVYFGRDTDSHVY